MKKVLLAGLLIAVLFTPQVSRAQDIEREAILAQIQVLLAMVADLQEKILEIKSVRAAERAQEEAENAPITLEVGEVVCVRKNGNKNYYLSLEISGKWTGVTYRVRDGAEYDPYIRGYHYGGHRFENELQNGRVRLGSFEQLEQYAEDPFRYDVTVVEGVPSHTPGHGIRYLSTEQVVTDGGQFRLEDIDCVRE